MMKNAKNWDNACIGSEGDHQIPQKTEDENKSNSIEKNRLGQLTCFHFIQVNLIQDILYNLDKRHEGHSTSVRC